jgi:hypothetical protein
MNVTVNWMTPGVESKIKRLDYTQKSLSTSQMINNGSTKRQAAAESRRQIVSHFLELKEIFYIFLLKD